jgi:hypothetical protein
MGKAQKKTVQLTNFRKALTVKDLRRPGRPKSLILNNLGKLPRSGQAWAYLRLVRLSPGIVQ